jgi:hypothetical protein
MTPLEAATEYRRCGWRVVPIPTGEKGPLLRGWQNIDLELTELPHHFGNGCNVGVILGSRSSELVDIDIDCPEALALADVYLPQTGAIFGRRSKPRSHRLYVSPGARYESFGDPILDGKGTLIELRTDGPDGGAHQTVFHPRFTRAGNTSNGTVT